MRLVSSIKAAIALIGGLYITFAQSHSAIVGLMTFGAYGVGLSLALLLAALYARKEFLPNLAEAILLLLLGIFAHLLMTTEVQLLGFKWLVASLGLSMAAVNLYQANSLGFKTRVAADWITNAAINAGFGLLFAFVSLDEVAAVGFFGAYLVVIAVHLGISAASPNAQPASK